MSLYYKERKISQNPDSKSNFNIYLLPLMLIAFIPLIIRYHSYLTHLGQYGWFLYDETADLFLYHKSLVFIILNSAMACLLVFKLIKDAGNKKWSKSIFKKSMPIFIPLAVYALLAFLSTVLSEHSYFGFHGIYEQFESVWVLLGYGLTVYYAFLFINTERDVRMVFWCIIISCIVICTIGVFQAFKLDFYSTSFAKSLYLPASLVNTDIKFTFEPGRVYASLYNPNYVGVYTGLLIPIVLMLLLDCKNKKLYFIYIPLLAALFICLVGSKSTGGFIAFIISILVIIIFFRKAIMSHWKIALFVLLCLFGSILAGNQLTNNQIFDKIASIFHSADTPQPLLNEIQTNDDNLTIIYNNETIVVRFNVISSEGKTDMQFDFKDKDGNLIPWHIQDGFVKIDDERFSTFVFGAVQFDNGFGFSVTIDGTVWSFTNQLGDNQYYMYTNTGKFDKVNNPAVTPFFKGKEEMMSLRGFIWGRTIPLLKNCIILGTGADTFSVVYPNDDYVSKFYHGYPNAIITKPHNLYLQIGVQTGVLSLIAFLLFYLMYFIWSFKLYGKGKPDSFLSKMGIAVLAGTFGYMVAGLANDSTVAVSPIYWLLMGLGLAINYMVRKNRAENSLDSNGM